MSPKLLLLLRNCESPFELTIEKSHWSEKITMKLAIIKTIHGPLNDLNEIYTLSTKLWKN